MWRRLSAGGGLTTSWPRGCLPDEQCLVTGSCLMSKSLLKLHLVCAEFDPKAQPDTLAHWSLIDVSVFAVEANGGVRGGLRSPDFVESDQPPDVPACSVRLRSCQNILTHLLVAASRHLIAAV